MNSSAFRRKAPATCRASKAASTLRRLHSGDLLNTVQPTIHSCGCQVALVEEQFQFLFVEGRFRNNFKSQKRRSQENAARICEYRESGLLVGAPRTSSSDENTAVKEGPYPGQSPTASALGNLSGDLSSVQWLRTAGRNFLCNFPEFPPKR